MLKTINTIIRNGQKTVPTQVTVEVTEGIGIHVMGFLHDISVKESLLRTVTALQSCGYSIPGMRIVIDVKPVVRDGAAALDLPIAIGIISASRQRELHTRGAVVVGELGLDGSVRDVGEGRMLAECARQKGFKRILLPVQDAEAAKDVEGVEVFAADSLDAAISNLEKQ